MNEVPLTAADRLETKINLEDTIEQKHTVAYLHTLLAQLSEREQELVALKYGAGHTNRRIARLTGLTETNIGSILHRAVQKLRAQWEME
jgi:RNA polymerase sigma-70 factor (ECF subfamily)